MPINAMLLSGIDYHYALFLHRRHFYRYRRCVAADIDILFLISKLIRQAQRLVSAAFAVPQ